MSSQFPFQDKPLGDSDPDLNDLDAALRRLSGDTHPAPGFVAQLRAQVEQKTASAEAFSPRRRGLNLTWVRPLIAQGALVLLLVGLIALAVALNPRTQPQSTPLPGVLTAVSTSAPWVDGIPGRVPRAAFYRLGKGRITALDTNDSNFLIAVASTTGVCIYDGDRAELEQWCAWTEMSVSAVAFNPTGDLLAAGLGDGRVQILDSATGQLRAERGSENGSSIANLAWDPSGAPVVVSVNAVGRVEAWDWQQNALRWGPLEQPTLASALDWAPGAGGESILALGGDDGLLFLDGATGLEQARYDPTWQVSPVLDVSSLAISSPDAPASPTAPAGSAGQWLVYAYRGGLAALKLDGWQVTGTRNWPLAVDSENPRPISFAINSMPNNPQYGLIVAAVLPEGIQFIDIEKDTVSDPQFSALVGTPIVYDTSIYFCAPDGRLLVWGFGGDAPGIWRSEYTTYLSDMVWAPSGIVATNGTDQVRIWQEDGALLDVVSPALDAESDLLIPSPDGEITAAVLNDGAALAVWDRVNNQLSWQVDLPTQPKEIAFAQDSSKIAVAGVDGRITAYERFTGQVTGEVQLPRPGARITALAWPPVYNTCNGEYCDILAVAWYTEADSASGIDLVNLSPSSDWTTRPLVKDLSMVLDLAWGPGGPESDGFLAGTQIEQAVIWDARTGEEYARLGENPQTASMFMPALAVSSYSSMLALSTRQGILVWNMMDGQAPRLLTGHHNIVRLAFSNEGMEFAGRMGLDNGKGLASASMDGSIVIWDVTELVEQSTITMVPQSTAIPRPADPSPTALPVDPTPTPVTLDPTPTPLSAADPFLGRLGLGSITTLDAAPDGRLAVGTTAGVCLHNTAMSIEWCNWLGDVLWTAFSPSGEYLAVGLSLDHTSTEKTVLILDGSGSILAQRRFQGSWHTPAPLAWDPSGAPKIAVAETGGVVSVWDWQADQIAWGAVEVSGPVGYDNDGRVDALDWSTGPNGESLLAVASTLGLSILDGERGELKQRYTPTESAFPIGSIFALAFAADDGLGGPGRHLAYANNEGGLVVLEMQGWQATGASRFDAPVFPIALAWAPSTGDLLSMRLALSTAGSVRVYEPFKKNGSPQGFPASALAPAAWSTTGAELFFSDSSGMLNSFVDGSASPYSFDYANLPTQLAWPASGDLYSFNANATNRWDVAGLQLGAVNRIAEGSGYLLLAVSPDGQRAAYSVSADKQLLLWDVPNNQELTQISMSPMGTPALFQAAAFSARSGHLLTLTADGQLALWDAATGQPILGASPLDNISSIDALAISPSGDTAAVAWTDTTQTPHLILYRLHGGYIQANIPIQTAAAQLAFSPDGRLAGINTAGQYINTLGVQLNLTAPGADSLPPGDLRSLAFSPDGARLATFGSQISIWDTATGDRLQTFPTSLGGFTSFVTTLAFRPDGLVLASSANGLITLWDLGAGPLPPPEVGPTPTPLPK